MGPDRFGCCIAVFEKADDVFHLLNAADKTLDDLDLPLHDWEYLGGVTRLPLWLRAIYRREQPLRAISFHRLPETDHISHIAQLFHLGPFDFISMSIRTSALPAAAATGCARVDRQPPGALALREFLQALGARAIHTDL